MSWITLGVGVAGMGLSAYGQSQQKPGQAGGIDVVTNPMFNNTEGDMQFRSDWSKNILNALGRGEEVPWWSQYKKKIQGDMSRQNYESAFGTPGYRTGTIGAATEIGALGGIGGAATARGVNKAVQDYAGREQTISRYMAELGSNVASQSEGRALQNFASMPMGPGAQAFQRAPQAAPVNPWSQIGGQLLGNMGSIDDMFSGTGTGGTNILGQYTTQLSGQNSGQGYYQDPNNFTMQNRTTGQGMVATPYA
jgi:hypothetical protein